MKKRTRKASKSRHARGAARAAKPKIVYSVVLPTYNESMNVLVAIDEIFKTLPKEKTEIIISDDDSPDRTWELIERLNDPHARAIRRVDDRGIAKSIADGIDAARGDIVMWMDCDLSMPPSALPRLIAPIEQGRFDITIGSRYVRGGVDTRPVIRRWTSVAINMFAWILLGHGIRDYDSGFIAVHKRVFESVKLPRDGYGEYFIEFVYTCARKGFRITEVGYVLHDRVRGESKSDPNFFVLLKYGFQYGMRVIKLRLGMTKTKQ